MLETTGNSSFMNTQAALESTLKSSLKKTMGLVARGDSRLSQTSQSKYKPKATKSIKGFVKMCEKLIKEAKYKECKTQTGKAIK